MKEYKCFACPKSAILTAISVSLLLLIDGFLIFTILEEESFLLKISIFLFSNLFILLPAYFFEKNTFSITYISKEGIRNKYISFRWDEITSYHICEFDRRLRNTNYIFKHPLIVCIGDVRSKYFVFCDMRKTVAFSLTKKNLKMIEELCEEKNETISELLTWVHFPMEH